MLRGMAALTMGILPERAILNAPDLQDLTCIGFGNALAVLTDGDVFLLHTGRPGGSKIEAADRLAESQIKLAHELDECQVELSNLAREQGRDFCKRGSTGKSCEFQRRCTWLAAKLVTLRGELDRPMPTEDVSLLPLRDALSQRWNIRNRLQEMANEVETLQQARRASEEARLFRLGQVAAFLALGILLADALAGPLSKWLTVFVNAPWLEFGTFWAVFLGSIVLALGATMLLRKRLSAPADSVPPATD